MFNDFYRGKSVLVTGHTGFKGVWLSFWLAELGAEVQGFSIDIPTKPALFEILDLENQIDHRFGDIRNYEDFASFLDTAKPDIVFHMAAQSLVRKGYDVPKLTFDTNLGGTVNVLEACRKHGISRTVVITTDKCYQNIETLEGYREDAPLGGKDPYSASKAAAELACAAYYHSFAQEGRNFLATGRAGNVLGGGDWSEDRIVPDGVRAWGKHMPLKIRNADAVRPWQHVLEPLSGYLWLGATLDQHNGQAFNFGPEKDSVRTVGELVKEFQTHLTDWKSKEAPSPSTKTEAKLLALNCDKAKQELQWQSVLSFKRNVEMTAQWYMNFREKSDMVAFTSKQIHEYSTLARERGLPWAR